MPMQNHSLPGLIILKTSLISLPIYQFESDTTLDIGNFFFLLQFFEFSGLIMKIRASSFLKNMFLVVVGLVKAKTMALKGKTSGLKTRLLVLGLLHNKKVLMKAIHHKIHSLISSQAKGEGDAHFAEERNKAIMVYASNDDAESTSPSHFTEPAGYSDDDDDDDDDDNYPDLRHSLFELEDEDDDEELELGDDANGSVIELVRNAKEDGTEFSLEDEIDHVADVYIKRFRKEIRMQKLESFKRYQEMLQRSV